MSLSPKMVIVGIVVVIVAASVLFLTINNLDKPIPKPLEDPPLLVESYDSKLSQTLVNEVIKKYDKGGKDLSALRLKAFGKSIPTSTISPLCERVFL